MTVVHLVGDLSKIFRANRDINPTRSNLIRHIAFAPRTGPAERLQRLASVTALLATSEALLATSEAPCTHVLQSRMQTNHIFSSFRSVACLHSATIHCPPDHIRVGAYLGTEAAGRIRNGPAALPISFVFLGARTLYTAQEDGTARAWRVFLCTLLNRLYVHALLLLPLISQHLSQF